jgi:TRAP-type mannitol/chloroaromatic compound transport system permease large subunit
MNWHSPMFTSFVTVQVVGFPVAFLIRAVTRIVRAYRGDSTTRKKNFLEAAANVCFAGTSIAFAFNIPMGVLLLVAGISLSGVAFMEGRKQAQVPLPDPVITKHVKRRKRGRRKIHA